MLTKLAALVQSKVAIAVLGVVLVGGGGAAAVAAGTGNIHLPQFAESAHTEQTPSVTEGKGTSTGDTNNHAHTVSFEGVLVGVSGTTISVQTEKSTTPVTITIDSNTKVNGELNGKYVSSQSDLANAKGHRVQVQADKQSDGSYLAWKVTIEGDESTNGTGNGTGDSSKSGDDSGKSGQNGQQTKDISGIVTSVGAASFIVTEKDGTTVTVDVSTSTHFGGSARSIADLKTNMTVSVEGQMQSDGTLAAYAVESEGGE
jgi:hypothetical protein